MTSFTMRAITVGDAINAGGYANPPLHADMSLPINAGGYANPPLHVGSQCFPLQFSAGRLVARINNRHTYARHRTCSRPARPARDRAGAALGAPLPGSPGAARAAVGDIGGSALGALAARSPALALRRAHARRAQASARRGDGRGLA